MAKRKKKGARARAAKTTRKGRGSNRATTARRASGSKGSKTSKATKGARAPKGAEGSAGASGTPVQSLTPSPALPVRERGRRERETRGGKSTLSVHELLAEVPQPPRPPEPGHPSAPSKPLSYAEEAAFPPAPHELTNHTQIYETLAALLVPYARKMESEMHPKIGFCLKVKSARTGRETHFGAVQTLPDGVAFHLFPLYAHPDLLEGISPELFTRMRGQTCFHFETLDAGLVAELAQLTHAGFERFLADGVF